MKRFLKKPIFKVAKLIKNKKVSPLEITKTILNKIEELNETHNIFITILRDEALKNANEAKKEIMQGDYKGPLHGIPISIKDNINVKNVPSTSGSFINRNMVSAYDALVVKQLRQKGAIIIGKTNMDEFANHVTGMNKFYGFITNPSNPKYIVGGSSGGSAVSVANHLSYASIGTDTSGSIRIPASLTGVVGFKPSYNLIPTTGVHPLSWSLDHVGILAKNCIDLSIMYQSTIPGLNKSTCNNKNNISIKNLKIGIIKDYFFDQIDPIIEKAMESLMKDLEKIGAKFKAYKIDKLAEKVQSQEVIIGAEAALIHHNKFEEHKNIYEQFNYEYLKKAFKINSRQYQEGLKKRENLREQINHLFSEVDVLITPTLSIKGPGWSGEKMNRIMYEEYLLNTLSRNTGPFNVIGLPALSLPIRTGSTDLPIGVQLIGEMYSDFQLITIGQLISEATGMKC